MLRRRGGAQWLEEPRALGRGASGIAPGAAAGAAVGAALLLSVAIAPSAGAQRWSPVAIGSTESASMSVHRGAHQPPLPRRAEDYDLPPGAGRWISSVLGGAVFGAIGGVAALPFALSESDDGNAAGMLAVGIGVGSFAGIALGAAGPTLRSACTFSERLGRAGVGSVLGLAVGALGGLSQSKQAALAVGALGATVGATVGAHGCGAPGSRRAARSRGVIR